MDNRASASPPGPVTSRKLLATRVLSVDAYWQALRKLKGRSPKEILVPLWPGESLQQYEREFLRWLAVGRLSITDLREDPAAERKYRLQFAETRVNRPRSNSQGATFHSRWQSRSRSPKRFGNVQQQPHASSRQDRVQPFERRSSTDSGHMLIARQSPDRPRHDRSSVQWHSQTNRYPDAHEAPLPCSNWQAPHGADLRHCQDSRAPPPRDVHRQYINDTQRWNHSRSRSPQYHARAASPPRTNTSFSHVRRSPLPHDQVRSNVDNLRRQLLAKRVVSVEVFRDEMNRLQNGVIHHDDLKRPNEAMVRIPVILWPDEVMIVYAQKFERWLESRQLSLALLRDNPAEERSLWYSFACMRAGTPELGEPGARSRSRSQSHSSSQSIQRSSERGRPPALTFAENNLGKSSNSESREHPFRREYARSPDHHGESRSAGIQYPPSMANPPQGPRLYNKKTRRQLLERRVLLLEDYQKEVDQSPGEKAANEGSLESLIPVPLYSRESMVHYDHRFWVWLRDYGETKETLRSNPLRERRFRMTFASLRLNKPQVLTTTGDLSIETQTTLIPRPNSETHTKIPVGILKTARAHLVMIGKRPADTVKQQAQAMPDEPSCKRARIEAEGMTQVHVTPDLSSSRSTVCPKQKRKPVLSLASSNQALPESSSMLTIASSTGTSSTATTASTSSSAVPVRPSILPQTAPEKKRIALAQAQTAYSASIPNQRKQKNMRAKQRVTASAKERKTATSSNEVATSTKTAAFRAKDMATNAETARLNKGLASKRQAKVRNRRTPELEPLTIKPDSAASHSSSLPSASSVPQESRAKPTPTTAAAPIRAPLGANVSPATTTKLTKEKPSVNVAENDSADTDAAESEPDIARTESMAQEKSDAESEPADESEQHDGDVMNPDGCCCNKCMRSWAKTLTKRMDQLEQNVLDLKWQVIGQVDVQAVTN